MTSSHESLFDPCLSLHDLSWSVIDPCLNFHESFVFAFVPGWHNMASQQNMPGWFCMASQQGMHTTQMFKPIRIPSQSIPGHTLNCKSPALFEPLASNEMLCKAAPCFHSKHAAKHGSLWVLKDDSTLLIGVQRSSHCLHMIGWVKCFSFPAYVKIWHYTW